MSKLNIEYTHNESVARIILNDGKGNILDHLMMEELQKLLDTYVNFPNLKLITFEKDMAEVMLRNFHQLFYTIKELAIPTLAKISGQCLGGGLELALMCNFLFADKSAKLGQPEIILGVFPPPASILLPLKIGYAKAEEILITGKTISAEEGEKIGLLNYVFENKDELELETNKWIEQHILPKSASSLRYSVKATRIKFNHILGNFLPHLENLYVKQLMETKDANEGINSFLEKRQAVWENC